MTDMHNDDARNEQTGKWLENVMSRASSGTPPDSVADQRSRAGRAGACNDDICENVAFLSDDSADEEVVVLRSGAASPALVRRLACDRPVGPTVADDLTEHLSLAARHPLVKAMSGEAAMPSPEPWPMAGDGPYSLFDADASQQAALGLARQGASFILQAPPGTDGRHAVSNLISEAMACGRTVLLLSNRHDLIDAAASDLEAAGLGGSYLDLRSPPPVLRSRLSRSLEPGLAPEPLPCRDDLIHSKARVDAYFRAVHKPREGIGLSLYDVTAKLAGLKGAEAAPAGWSPSMSWRELEALAPTIEGLDKLVALTSKVSESPWRDCLVDPWKPGSSTEVARRLSELKSARNRLADSSAKAAAEMGMGAPTCAAEVAVVTSLMRSALSSPSPDRSWFVRDRNHLLELADNLEAAYSRMSEMSAWMLARFDADVMDLDIPAMHERFQAATGPLARLRSDVRADLSALRGMWRGGYKLTFEQACEELAEMDQAVALAMDIKRMEAEAGAAFGDRFRGRTTDWTELEESIVWTMGHMEAFGAPANETVLEMICGGRSGRGHMAARLDELDGAAVRLDLALLELGRSFDLAALAAGRPLGRVTFDELADWAQSHLDTMTAFRELADASRACRKLEAAGLGDLVAKAADGPLPEGTMDGLRRSYLESWQAALLQDPALSLDDQARSYAELDRADVEAGPMRVQSELRGRKRSLLEEPSLEQANSLWRLRRDLANRDGRSFMATMTESWSEISLLAPCALADPSAVARCIDPQRVAFDVVIIDRASDVRPDEALGAIIRSRQAILVGDDKPAPPARRPGRAPKLESVLDACSFLPRSTLRWADQDGDGRLTEFAAQKLYGGGLMTFPSTEAQLPAAFVHVADGVIDRDGTQCNQAEAEAAADVVQTLLASGETSIGVTALSAAQAFAVMEELERRSGSDGALEALIDRSPALADCIGSLSGEPHDVVVLCVGYGPDPEGRIEQDFGDLDRPGGERRLHEALAAARKRMVAVSSLLPEDVAGDSPGAAMLRDCLQHVIRSSGESTSDPDEYALSVMSALEARGLRVRHGVGSSDARVDIAVERDGRYVLGVLLDGPSCASLPSARERERLLPQALEARGWQLERVRLPDWVRDADGEADRVAAAVDAAVERAAERERAAAQVALEGQWSLEELGGVAAVQEQAEAIMAPDAADAAETAGITGEAQEVPIVDDAVLEPETEPEPACAQYVPVDLRAEPGLIRLASTDLAAMAREGVLAVVEGEGPVHVSVVKDRIVALLVHCARASSYDGRTVATKMGVRQAVVDKLVDDAIASLDCRVDRDGGFLSPAGRKGVTARRSVERRPLDIVSEAELDAAVRYALAEGVEPDGLAPFVAGLFGYRWPGRSAKARINASAARQSSSER